MIATTHKNAAAASTATALRIRSIEVTRMLDPDNTTTKGSLLDVLDACAKLADVAGEASSETFTMYRHGLRFERSGDSMAVYNGIYRIDRVTLSTPSERAFLEAVDLWELARYLEVA